MIGGVLVDASGSLVELRVTLGGCWGKGPRLAKEPRGGVGKRIGRRWGVGPRVRACVCVSSPKRRKVAKGGESEWVEGGEGLEKKVGGEPGGRVATHSGPSGDSAMRRVTLFLNGSPKNGKVRGSVGRR